MQTDSHVTLTTPPPATAGVEPLLEMTLRGDCTSDVKIAVINVDGLLLNMDMTGLFSHGENPVALFREKLDTVAGDPCVRAVVVRINSPGGGVTASDVMWHDLMAFKARCHIPVVACLMDLGTGGAYYLATAADQIWAHPTSITGGFGVILNTYNLQDMMAKFNITGVPVKAGDYTDLGSPIRKISKEGRKLLQDIADQYHTRFEHVIGCARPRHDPRESDDFDGRIFTADQAQQRGLIDCIGYLDDAICGAEKLAALGPAKIVMYHRRTDCARACIPSRPTCRCKAASCRSACRAWTAAGCRPSFISGSPTRRWSGLGEGRTRSNGPDKPPKGCAWRGTGKRGSWSTAATLPRNRPGENARRPRVPG